MKPRLNSFCYQGLWPVWVRRRANALGRVVLRGAITGAATLGVLAGMLLSASADTFPVGPETHTTNSLGVFRIVVAPAFQSLVEYSTSPAYPAYPGYNTPGDPSAASMSSPPYTLTSPLLFDSGTSIAESAGYTHPLIGTMAVGNPSLGNIGYSDFSCGGIPISWLVPPPPPPGNVYRELETEIDNFELVGGFCTSTDPRIASLPTNIFSYPAVKAGPAPGVSPAVPGVLLPSLGLVQSMNYGPTASIPAFDFPARSFFDIHVEVYLPAVPSTLSASAFPPAPGYPLGAAVLYNDCSHPLVVTNLGLTSLPPEAIYTHGASLTAIPMKFKYANSPYWNADDIFGYLVLAGHGVIMSCGAKSSAFLDTTLGPIGTSALQLPIPWVYANTDFPSHNAAYGSVRNIDMLNFPLPGGGGIMLRNLSVGDLDTPIAPPPVDTTATYHGTNVSASLEVSIDNGSTWYPAAGTGMMTATIYHSTNDTPDVQIFETELTQLDLDCNGLFPFLLRESPTKASFGQNTIESSPQGYEISSFFDSALEISTDSGVTWFPAERLFPLQVLNGPCGAPGARVHVVRTGSQIVVSWQDGSYTLQGSLSLAPANWVDIPGTSPITLGLTNNFQFLRLTCQ
jgi:hypothetical protein